MRDRGYPSEPRQFRDPGFEDAFDYIREVRNEREPPQKAARDIDHSLRTVEQLLDEIRSSRVPFTYGQWVGFLDRIEENLPHCELFKREVLLRGGGRDPERVGENISRSIVRYRNSYGIYGIR